VRVRSAPAHALQGRPYLCGSECNVVKVALMRGSICARVVRDTAAGGRLQRMPVGLCPAYVPVGALSLTPTNHVLGYYICSTVGQCFA